jgi:hypothetical protein
VAEVGGGARWRQGRHRLTGRWINGDGSDKVRVRILGCRHGAASTRLEGARGATTVRLWAVGAPPQPWAGLEGRVKVHLVPPSGFWMNDDK